MAEDQNPFERRVSLMRDQDNTDEKQQTFLAPGPIDDEQPKRQIDHKKYQRKIDRSDLLIAFP